MTSAFLGAPLGPFTHLCPMCDRETNHFEWTLSPVLFVKCFWCGWESTESVTQVMTSEVMGKPELLPLFEAWQSMQSRILDGISKRAPWYARLLGEHYWLRRIENHPPLTIQCNVRIVRFKGHRYRA